MRSRDSRGPITLAHVGTEARADDKRKGGGVAFLLCRASMSEDGRRPGRQVFNVL